MNKTAIRQFAAAARRTLTDSMQQYGLSGAAAEEAAYQCFVCLIESHYLASNRIPAQDALPEPLPPALMNLQPETLLPDSLRLLLHAIPAQDWQEVQILGWLHQFYHADDKDRVFAGFKQSIKVTAASLPAATQLFTPDWIVRYLTDTALGLLFPAMQSELSYFAAGSGIPAEDSAPEAVRILDPCMGCGNILVYAFDVLMRVYRAHGWADADAVRSILTNNLFGLDIDRRAVQLGRFALRMKAQQYAPGILQEGIEPNLASFADVTGISLSALPAQVQPFAAQFHDADTLGSLLTVHPPDVPLPSAPAQLSTMERIARMLDSPFDAVITNPPYMGRAKMSRVLSEFVSENFPRSKNDLFACFIERCLQLTRRGGYCAMLTQQSWMFLQSFALLRQALLEDTLLSLVHLGQNAFESSEVGTIVQTAAFVLRRGSLPGCQSLCFDLCSYRAPEEKQRAFLAHEHAYYTNQREFSRLPGHLFAYWASDAAVQAFAGAKLSDLAQPRQGMTTSDNKRFVRRWFEVDRRTICFSAHNRQEARDSGCRWFPYNKGGGFRKWYGNHEYVINFEDDGRELRAFHAQLNKEHSGGRIKNQDYYFRASLTWTFIANTPGFRSCPAGSIFDVAGSSLFVEPEREAYVLALLCSKVTQHFLGIINPTMNIQAADIRALPYIEVQDERIEPLVRENIALCRTDWDSFETSWDFTRHPLLGRSSRISEAFAQWEAECESRFAKLRANEETLNRILIRGYHLEAALSPEVPDKEITVRRADLRRDIRSLISYAVGCVFGRFGDAADAPDALPIEGECSLTQAVIAFLAQSFGSQTLEENLAWTANVLGGKGTPREILAQYLRSGFYADHCRIYQKRPVYWLMRAGRGGFRAMVYLHRYRASTLPHILHDMLEPRIRQDRAETDALTAKMAVSPRPEQATLRRRYSQLAAQIAEEETLADKLYAAALAPPKVDLHDGVVQNHAKFGGLFERIRG